MSGTICRIKNRYSKEYDLIKEALLNHQDLIVSFGMSLQDISLKDYLIQDDIDFTLSDNLLTTKDKKSIIRNIYNELTEQQKEEFRANNQDLLDLVNNTSEKQYDSQVVNNSNFTDPLQSILPRATKLGTSSVNFIPIFSPEMNRILFSEITSEFQQRCFWNENDGFFYYIDSNESLTDALELYKEKLLSDLFEYVNPEDIERFSFGTLSDEKYNDYKRLMEEAWKLIKTKVESKNGKLDIQITENTRKTINGIKAFYILNNFDNCIKQTLGDNIVIKDNEKDKLNTSEDKYSKKRASRENVNWNDNFKTSDGDNLVDRIMDIFTTTTVVPETGMHLQKDFMDKIILVCKEIYENDFIPKTEKLPKNLETLMDSIASGDTNKAIEALIKLLTTENSVTSRIGRNECRAFGQRLENSQSGFNFQKGNLNAKEAAQFDLQYNIAAKLINNFKKGLLTYTSLDKDGNISTTSCVDKKKSKEYARRKLKSAILRNQSTHSLGFYSPNIMVANTTSTNIQDLFSEKAQNYLTKITGINFKDPSFISRFNNATNIATLNRFLADLNYAVKKASEHKSNLSFEKALEKELDTLQTLQSWVQFSNILTEENEYELQRMFDQNGNELPKTTIPVLSTTIADLRKEARDRKLDGNCNILLREGLTRKHAEALGGKGSKYNSYSSMISFLNDVMTEDGVVKRWVELEPQTLLYNSIFSLYFNQVVNNQVATFQLDVASDKPKVPAININLASQEGKKLLESTWSALETELFKTNKNYYIKVKNDIVNAWNQLKLKDSKGNEIEFTQVSQIVKYLKDNPITEASFVDIIRDSVGTNGELFQKGIVWDVKGGNIIINPVLIDELARYDVSHEETNTPTAKFNEYCYNSFKAFLSDLIKNRVDFNKFLVDNFDLLSYDKKQRILQLFSIPTENLSAEKTDAILKDIKEKTLSTFKNFGDYKEADLDKLIASNSPIISMLRKYMAMYNLTREGGLQLMQRHYWAHGGSSENAKISKAVKRNNAESGTCAFLQQDVKYGVPKKIRTAQIQSLNTPVKNMFGDSATIHSHDGAIFTLGVARFWERNSSPSIFIADAAKTITFNPQGAGFIQYKCADYAMTNSWIRQTLRNGEGGKEQSYDGRILARKMMSEGKLSAAFWDNWQKNIGIKFGINIPIVTFNGRKAKLDDLSPVGQNSVTAIYKYLDDSSYVPDNVVQKCLGVIQSDEYGNLKCETVYDLWKILGAEYCEEYKEDGSIDYGENSQELIAYLISEFDPSIKEQLICKIIDPESSKSTGQITNSREDTFNSDKPLITTNIKTKWYGAQLDYSHQSDEDEIAGPTQAIAAICFNGENSEMVADLYETLGKVTTESLGDVITLMDEKNKTAFYRKLGKKCIDTLKSNNIVSNTQVILEQALREIVKNTDEFAPKALPLSDNKVYHLAAEQILSTLNKTIRQRFAGTAVIQNPSQGIISCYEDIHGVVFTASEITRKANQWAQEIDPDTGLPNATGTQDSIIQAYLNRSPEFGPIEITSQNLGLLNIGYRVSLVGKEMEISDPQDLWNLGEAISKGKEVKILHNKARNLATTNITFDWINNEGIRENTNIWMLPSTQALLKENKKGLTPIRIWHVANVRALKELGGFYKSLDAFRKRELTKVENIQFKGGEQALPKQYRRLMGLNDTMGNIRSQGVDYFKNVARVRLQLSESAKPTSFEEFAVSTDHFDVKYTNQEVESNTYLEKVNGGYRVTKENGDVIQGLILPVVDNVAYEVNVITDENGKDVVTVQTNIPLWVGSVRVESKQGWEYQQADPIPAVNYIENLISKLQDANWHTVTASPDNWLFSTDKKNPGPLSQYTERKITDTDISNLAAKMWTSFEMLRKTVSIRIPSQSFQSFLPNDTVMFTETEDNNGYMNSWEEWFQGSDFDIDKAYTLLFQVNSNGFIDGNVFSDYTSPEQLMESLLLATPSGEEIMIGVNKDGQQIIKITNESIKNVLLDLNERSDKNYSLRDINEILKAQKDNSDPVEGEALIASPELIALVKKLNIYNKQSYSEDYNKNKIAAGVRWASQDLRNLRASQVPMDSESVNSAIKQSQDDFGIQSESQYLNFNPGHIFEIQYQAAIGKKGVGIAANVLKVDSNTQQVYNRLGNFETDSEGKVSSQVVDKEVHFEFKLKDGKTRKINYNFYKVANTKISREDFEKLVKARMERTKDEDNTSNDLYILQKIYDRLKTEVISENERKEFSARVNKFIDTYYAVKEVMQDPKIPFEQIPSFYNVLYENDVTSEQNVADIASVFISLCVDNMKELQLYRIGATPELLKIPLAMISMGMDIKDVTDVCVNMLLPLLDELKVNEMRDKKLKVKDVIIAHAKNDVNYASLLKIFDIGDEMTILAQLFKINQGASVRPEECMDFILRAGKKLASLDNKKLNNYSLYNILTQDFASEVEEKAAWDEMIQIAKEKGMTFNIPEILYNSKHFLSQLKAMARVLKGQSNTMAVRNITDKMLFSMEAAAKNTLKTRQIVQNYLFTKALKTMKNFTFVKAGTVKALDGYDWAPSISDRIEIGVSNYNQVSNFIDFIEQGLIPQLVEKYKDNLFFQNLKIIDKNGHYGVPFDIFNKGDIQTKLDINNASKAIQYIAKQDSGLKTIDGQKITIGDLLYMYSEIVNQRRNNATSVILSSVIGDSGYNIPKKIMDAYAEFDRITGIATSTSPNSNQKIAAMEQLQEMKDEVEPYVEAYLSSTKQTIRSLDNMEKTEYQYDLTDTKVPLYTMLPPYISTESEMTLNSVTAENFVKNTIKLAGSPSKVRRVTWKNNILNIEIDFIDKYGKTNIKKITLEITTDKLNNELMNQLQDYIIEELSTIYDTVNALYKSGNLIKDKTLSEILSPEYLVTDSSNKNHWINHFDVIKALFTPNEMKKGEQNNFIKGVSDWMNSQHNVLITHNYGTHIRFLNNEKLLVINPSDFEDTERAKYLIMNLYLDNLLGSKQIHTDTERFYKLIAAAIESNSNEKGLIISNDTQYKNLLTQYQDILKNIPELNEWSQYYRKDQEFDELRETAYQNFIKVGNLLQYRDLFYQDPVYNKMTPGDIIKDGNGNEYVYLTTSNRGYYLLRNLNPESEQAILFIDPITLRKGGEYEKIASPCEMYDYSLPDASQFTFSDYNEKIEDSKISELKIGDQIYLNGKMWYLTKFTFDSNDQLRLIITREGESQVLPVSSNQKLEVNHIRTKKETQYEFNDKNVDLSNASTECKKSVITKLGEYGVTVFVGDTKHVISYINGDKVITQDADIIPVSNITGLYSPNVKKFNLNPMLLTTDWDYDEGVIRTKNGKNNTIIRLQTAADYYTRFSNSEGYYDDKGAIPAIWVGEIPFKKFRLPSNIYKVGDVELSDSLKKVQKGWYIEAVEIENDKPVYAIYQILDQDGDHLTVLKATQKAPEEKNIGGGKTVQVFQETQYNIEAIDLDKLSDKIRYGKVYSPEPSNGVINDVNTNSDQRSRVTGAIAKSNQLLTQLSKKFGTQVRVINEPSGNIKDQWTARVKDGIVEINLGDSEIDINDPDSQLLIAEHILRKGIHEFSHLMLVEMRAGNIGEYKNLIDSIDSKYGEEIKSIQNENNGRYKDKIDAIEEFIVRTIESGEDLDNEVKTKLSNGLSQLLGISQNLNKDENYLSKPLSETDFIADEQEASHNLAYLTANAISKEVLENIKCD